MISANLIWGLSLIVIIVSFLGLIVSSLIERRNDEPRISLLNYFPYEVIKGKISNIFLIILCVALFSPLLFVIPNFGEMGDLAVFNLVITCLFGLSGLAIFAVSKIKIQYTKEHIYCSTALIAAAFLMSALTCVRAFISFNIRTTQLGIIHIVIASLACLFAVLMLGVMFNPKLKDWPNLEEETQGDQKVYKRPKVFVLPLSEWIAIGVILLSAILFLISVIKF